jgi:general secretion pathway protein A
MYLSHYHLKVKPFQISPDPKFLWLGESHRKALSIFKEGIIENRGLILLVGDVGTGKTTLINKLLDSLDENTLVASVQYPGFDILDFYNFLAASFNMSKKFSNKGDFLVQFIHFLHEKYSHKNKVLLIIDEAQGLSDEVLDEIRLLSNLERMKVKLLNIFLVGQNEMEQKLADPNNRMLAQTIATRYYLGPLKNGEVKDYVNFRLQVAGANHRIFSKRAIREIVESSQCYPRLINVICDHALLTGYVQGKSKIDAAVIKECAKEYQLEKLDETQQVVSDNRIEKQADASTSKTGSKYHWAMPAVLVLILFLLIFAGYFFSLRKGNEALRPTIEERAQEPTLPVAAEDNPQSDNIDLDDGNTPKKRVITDEKQTFSFTEEDLGKDENQVENPPGPAELKNAARKTPPLSQLSEFAKNSSEAPADPYPDGKLTLTVPPDAEKLPKETYAQLKRFLPALTRHSEANILIESYTDSYGSARRNQKLSQLRADMVKEYFITQGIDPTRIKAIGLGDKDPITSNTTLAGRNINRRIEIKLFRE